jgi:hypothetical protein
MRERKNSRAGLEPRPTYWEEIDSLMTPEAEARADSTNRPVRVVRETEVLRIPRPTDVLEDEAFEEQSDLTNESAAK